jgi:hypothetical protein
MTTEEKQLLLEDLCARLPYGLKVNIDGVADSVLTGVYDDRVSTERGINYPIRLVKLYLRPLSSMTEKEMESLRQEHLKDEKLYVEAINGDGSMRGKVITHYAADYCDEHHLDYRGLIQKGLALEAPEGMY